VTLKEQIEQEIAVLQARLNNLNRVPTDTYPFGTVVRFAANNNTSKWHYIKTAEDSWKSLEEDINTEQDLASWILEALESSIGYFEVYVLTVANTPLFTSE
jgi:hypothetical protein